MPMIADQPRFPGSRKLRWGTAGSVEWLVVFGEECEVKIVLWLVGILALIGFLVVAGCFKMVF